MITNEEKDRAETLAKALLKNIASETIDRLRLHAEILAEAGCHKKASLIIDQIVELEELIVGWASSKLIDLEEPFNLRE